MVSCELPQAAAQVALEVDRFDQRDACPRERPRSRTGRHVGLVLAEWMPTSLPPDRDVMRQERGWESLSLVPVSDSR
jgi:hypothetical protein